MTTRGQSGADQASSHQRLTALAPHAGSKRKNKKKVVQRASLSVGSQFFSSDRKRWMATTAEQPAFHPSASPSSPSTQTNNGGRVMRLLGASEDTR